MVSWFFVRPTSKSWLLKIVQFTMEHDPFDAMDEKIHVDCYIHLAFTYSLRWSLKHSVKRTWTGSASPTNETASSLMVTGISLVCEVALIFGCWALD
jgi:hypothetical protein